jgi:hypothetical protein
MELTERIPLAKINFLKSMDFKTFKQYTPKIKNDDERRIKFDIMQSFCETNIKTRGETKRIYSYTQTTPLEVGGRLYCGNSIQGLQKDFRGLLLTNITTDIDMKNAHPVILRYLCKLHSIPCPNLSWYIDHRDQVLEDYGPDGKTDFLKAVNDDKINRKIKQPFFKDFDKECKVIQKKLTEIRDYEHIVNSVPSTRQYNWLGSAINRILCVFENKILQEIISVCNKRQIEICSLMFDGLMMYGNQNQELLDEITEFVNSKFEGLDMVFAYKEHSQLIQMPADFQIEEKQEIILQRPFSKVADEFEKTHCKINDKGFFIKQTPIKNVIMTKSHLITSYENITYEKLSAKGEIIEANFINDWIKDNPSQRCYDDIECYPDPTKCPDNIFNTWRPFAMELVKEYTPNPEALEMIRKHIKILCNNDEDVALYLECWIAQMLQFPDVKSNCPTIISNQGAGKGTLLKLLAAFIGEDKYVETRTPSRDVWGNFNGRMANTFLINLDELSRKESLECEGEIKGLITNPRMTINEKGVKQYGIISYHRFIATTNNEDPVKTEKDDRRNWIVRASDELIGNVAYFNKINEYLDDVDAVKTCYEYFKSIPYMEDFKEIKMPNTEHQQGMKETSISPLENWVKSLVTENFYEQEKEITNKEQYELFNHWCKKCGLEFKMNAIQFGVRLMRLKLSGIEFGRHTKYGDTRLFKIPLLKEHFKMNDLVIEDLDEKDNAIDM